MKYITFAGVPGCGKTPVANYLSWNLDLPIFENDAIRSEVKQDGYVKDWVEEHKQRKNARLDKLHSLGRDCIVDSSVDRLWPEVKKSTKHLNIDYFIISFDISKQKLLELYQATGYLTLQPFIDKYLADHHKFLDKHKDDINLSITDQDYPERLDVALKQVSKWLS